MKKTLLLFFAWMVSISYTKAQLNESFDGTTFPPTGWLNVHSVGPNTMAIWERATVQAFGGDIDPVTFDPFYVDPHSGAGMAQFRSYDFAAGNGAHLITSAVNLSSGGPHTISFWMYRDNLYSSQDSISVYINTTQSATGASFLGKILRKRSYPPVETGPDGWYNYSFNIPPGFNSATNYFIFSAVSRFGNNLFIDDIAVTSQPTCGVPTAFTGSNYNYAAGTISLAWTAPVVGSPAGYEWVMNTTGTPPASGTPVAGTSINVTGLTSGIVNYVLVRTNCGVGGYSSWASYALAALPCAATTAPAAGATNVPQSATFTWSAVPGADSYNFYLGTTAGNAVNIGNLSATTVPLSNLIPLQTYYWYIVPVSNGVAAPNSGCTANSFTVAAEGTTPPNNPCSGAININAGSSGANIINATTVGASISLPGESCGGFTGSPDDDVWFEFTTSASAPTGTITMTPNATGGIFDIVAQVYAASSCSSLGSPAICVDATVDADPEVLDLADLSPNTHYYMRVYSFSNDVADRGQFTIVVSAGSTLPVRLASFTARRANGVNILTWTTQQEINTSHFTVERSNDGRNFRSIGNVVAAGNSNSQLTYSFTDRQPARGNNYYRLRTFDKDNSSKVSDTRRIRNDGNADISIYPNPATSRITVSINADKATEGQLIVMDISGKIAYTRTLKLAQGTTALPVPLDNIAAGSYILKIQLNDDVIIRKFNKQ